MCTVTSQYPPSSLLSRTHTHQPPTEVEQTFLNNTDHPFLYDGEQIPSIEVINSIELGKLTALRFIEWVIHNPDGVVALPTGKSPEIFIRFLELYKNNWTNPDVQKELHSCGITAPTFPDTSHLKFVQLDEFYPIAPNHRNSFHTFVTNYYLPLLNIKKEQALLINSAEISDVKEFCTQYEAQIDAWGGIGFFLGGIGPDGHIAFNVAGSEPNSTTRLVTLNYQTACTAATSLGGMAYARNKTALTIGLDTIMRKKDATIIIIAAGEGKAPMVAHAIEKKDMNYPAAALQTHAGTRFYLTRAAASHLNARYLSDIKNNAQLLQDTATIDRILSNVSLTCNKPLLQLTTDDCMQTEDGTLLVQAAQNIAHLTRATHDRYIKKLTPSNPSNKSILHTAPHHDDVMLSYHPLAVASLAKNRTHVAYATSGFTAVTNDYLMDITAQINESFCKKNESEIFSNNYELLLDQFANAYEQNNHTAMRHAEQLIVAHLIATLFTFSSAKQLAQYVYNLHNVIIPSIIPGEKDTAEMQQLKGAIRETEVDRMWRIHGIGVDNITHLRSKFYTGDYFTPRPTFQDDVTPLLKLLQTHQPDVVTLALDPEGTGPDTHYKVLQVVANAVRAWDKQPEIWGYRNVWYRFKPYDATLMAPVSENELSYLHDIFMACFSTQKDAAFPSHFHDGPFSELSVAIQKEQLATMRTLLGNEFFDTHPDEKMRNAAGLCFIKRMPTDEFLAASDTLREYTETVPK